jgi:hypothetical protein
METAGKKRRRVVLTRNTARRSAAVPRFPDASTVREEF